MYLIMAFFCGLLVATVLGKCGDEDAIYAVLWTTMLVVVTIVGRILVSNWLQGYSP